MSESPGRVKRSPTIRYEHYRNDPEPHGAVPDEHERAVVSAWLLSDLGVEIGLDAHLTDEGVVEICALASGGDEVWSMTLSDLIDAALSVELGQHSQPCPEIPGEQESSAAKFRQMAGALRAEVDRIESIVSTWPEELQQ